MLHIPEEKLRFLTEYYKFQWKNYDSSQNTTNSGGKTTILAEYYKCQRKNYDAAPNIPSFVWFPFPRDDDSFANELPHGRRPNALKMLAKHHPV